MRICRRTVVLVQTSVLQIEAAHAKFHKAYNQHDAAAIAALFPHDKALACHAVREPLLGF